MSAKTSLALKFLQWFIRGVQFCCSALVLALFSFYLAIGKRNNQTVPTWVRAVEGISGIGVVYTLIGLLLLCCLAGHPFASFVAIVLDVAFVGAFIYVAQANRDGASACTGTVQTPFGSGDAGTNLDGLPSFSQICKIQTAVLAVSIVAVVFFILSALVEVVLVRNRRKEARFGPSPANNYTSGYGKRKGLFGLFRRNKTGEAANPNELPQHTHPNEVRPSYNTETTAVGHETAPYHKYGDAGFQHDGQTAYPETGAAGGAYRYNDGTYQR